MNSRLREVIPNRIKGDSLIHVEAGGGLDHDGFFYLPSGLVSFF